MGFTMDEDIDAVMATVTQECVVEKTVTLTSKRSEWLLTSPLKMIVDEVTICTVSIPSCNMQFPLSTIVIGPEQANITIRRHA